MIDSKCRGPWFTNNQSLASLFVHEVENNEGPFYIAQAQWCLCMHATSKVLDHVDIKEMKEF